MSLKGQQLLSLGLTLLNATGIVGTFAMTVKESKKANEDLEKVKDKGFKEKAKVFIKDYKFSLLFGLATLASGVGSRIIGAKTEASLIATAAMLDAGYKKYRGKIKDTLGIDVDKKIRQAVAEDEIKDMDIPNRVDKQLYHIDGIGYFWANPVKFYRAFHRMYVDLEGVQSTHYDGSPVLNNYTFRDFLAMIDAEPLKHLTDIELNFGWSYDYLSEEYDTCQLEMEEEYRDTDNGIKCCYIWFVQEPIWNPEMWSEYVYDMVDKRTYFKGAENRINTHSHLYTKINTRLDKKRNRG